jgi:hypothetical protein
MSPGIPDMRHINRHLAVTEVAGALDLRLDGTGKIHCWHPERHKNGDRTASVGIRTVNNTVKCFGCDSKPMGPIDMVMDVLTLSAGDAGLWISVRFDVPMIPARKRIEEPDRWRGQAGHYRGLELLIRSGLFGVLSEPTRSIAPVLLAMCEKESPMDREFPIQISYGAITRYSSISSPNAVRKALLELNEIGFLKFAGADSPRGPSQPASTYIMTPNSDALYELAQAFAAQMKTEIAAERELRARLRREKTRAWRANGKA